VAILASAAEKVIYKVLGHGWTHRRQLLLAARCSLPPWTRDVRFSFSALLKLECDDTLLLIRNAHRPECFSPIGGVFKHSAAASGLFNKLDVQFQTSPKPDDMLHDLRGFIPRRHLPQLTAWYIRERDRETGTVCIRRELLEELGEVNLRIKVPDPFPVRHVRTVVESLRFLPDEGYEQHRIFEIYEPEMAHREISEFCKKLAAQIGQRKNLIRVSRDEVFATRSSRGDYIAPITKYCYSSRPVYSTGVSMKK
jgi:hypothetical protein